MYLWPAVFRETGGDLFSSEKDDGAVPTSKSGFAGPVDLLAGDVCGDPPAADVAVGSAGSRFGQDGAFYRVFSASFSVVAFGQPWPEGAMADVGSVADAVGGGIVWGYR